MIAQSFCWVSRECWRQPCFVLSPTVAERRALLSFHLHFVAHYKFFVTIIIIIIIRKCFINTHNLLPALVHAYTCWHSPTTLLLTASCSDGDGCVKSIRGSDGPTEDRSGLDELWVRPPKLPMLRSPVPIWQHDSHTDGNPPTLK